MIPHAIAQSAHGAIERSPMEMPIHAVCYPKLFQNIGKACLFLCARRIVHQHGDRRMCITTSGIF